VLKHRLIPVLLLQHGLLVRSELFKIHQVIGNPIHEVERYNEWTVDELVYLDITTESEHYDLRRNDQKVRDLTDPIGILEHVARTCFMPLTWGGRIRSLDDMRARIARGADKVTVNTEAVRDPELITRGARVFGSQAIVVSIDVKRTEDGTPEVYVDGGSRPTGMHAAEWAREAEARGAGEILLQSIDKDGTGKGYDLELIHDVATSTNVPVVACSGVGTWEHFAQGIEAGASAVAAANIFHFHELSDRNAKRAMRKHGIEVRL